MDYPYYALMFDLSDGPIQLVKLHDDNHPEIIALFPREQRTTAQWIQEFLNKDKFGIPIKC